jgi:23S rRNA (guanosine2251-2'-O)-methyltransferase
MFVYGKNSVKELLNSEKKINKAIIYNNFNDNDIILFLKKNNIHIEYKDKKELDNIVSGNHQGIIVDVEDYKYYELDAMLNKINKEKPLLLIMDHIQDPHNLGAIIRTAEAAGVDGIIITKDRCVEVNSTVIRTSVGAADYVPICMVTNLNNAINKLKDNGYWIIGADMDGINYRQQDYNMPIALVIGSEGKGISELIKKSCDFIVSIPMKGKINSLNASVAAGIIIYGIIDNR